MNKAFKIFNNQKGFTLYVAVIVMGTLLLVSLGLVNLAVRQSFISAFSRESQHAFYAADTGVECALYWDIQNPSGNSAFATSTGTTISCSNAPSLPVGGTATSTFTFGFPLEPYCAVVTVNKRYVSGVLKTTIESKGYNTCDLTNLRRVERAVRATY